MTEVNSILQARGVWAVAERAGAKPFPLTIDGQTYEGWLYPIYNSKGQPYEQPRWKNAGTDGPKYYWPKGQPDKGKYYFLPGLLTAIQAHHGQVYIASGEPDVWAYHAAGIDNVFCWFGETALPATLIADLHYMGVENIVYAHDLDDTGLRAAARIVEMCEEGDVGYYIARLPGEMGSKTDINQVWINVHFDAQALFNAVWTTSADLTELALYRNQRGNSSANAGKVVADTVKDWRNEWQQIIIKAMGPAATKSGAHEFWRCPLPNRHGQGDRHPSFRFSEEKTPGFPWPVCSCDIQNDPDPWGAVAGALGLDSWERFKLRKGEETGATFKRNPTPRPPLVNNTDVEQPKLTLIKMADVYADLIDELDGKKVPEGIPIPFPYETVHRFGGFAEYLWTGIAVAIGGISAGGKTLWMRVLLSYLLRAGYDVAWWGPEFSPNQYGLQDLQRAGGLNFRQISQFRVIHAVMRDRGITLEQAMIETGLSIPGGTAIEDSKALLRSLMVQPGQMYIIKDQNAPVDEVMDMVRTWADARRKEGGKPVALGWDYLQLTNLPGKRDWTWGERAAYEIKRGCFVDNANLIAFMGVQSRKADAEKVREDGEQLKVGAAQGLDEKLFNLWLTLTPVFEDGHKLDRAIIGVEKNNMGDTGSVTVHAKWSRLAILDEEYRPVKKTPIITRHETGPESSEFDTRRAAAGDQEAAR